MAAVLFSHFCTLSPAACLSNILTVRRHRTDFFAHLRLKRARTENTILTGTRHRRGKYSITECDSVSIKRGDIYYADLSPVVGSEQGGLRPVLIVQNDVGNRYSPTVIAAAITSRMGKTKLPTHIDIHADEVGLSRDSVVLLEQIRTIDKRRLREKMGHLDENMMGAINDALGVSFGLTAPGETNRGDGTTI